MSKQDVEWFRENYTRKLKVYPESFESELVKAIDDRTTHLNPINWIGGDGSEMTEDSFSFCGMPRSGGRNALPPPFEKVSQIYTLYTIRLSSVKCVYDIGSGEILVVLKN